MDSHELEPHKARQRRANTVCPASTTTAANLRVVPWCATNAIAECDEPVKTRYSNDDMLLLSPVVKLKVQPPQRPAFVYDSDDAADNSDITQQDDDATDTETDTSRPVTPVVEPRRRKVTIAESPVTMFPSRRRMPQRRNSADARSSSSGNPFLASNSASHVHAPSPSKLSMAQKRGCFQYIKRRHSMAMAFASTSLALQHANSNSNNMADTSGSHSGSSNEDAAPYTHSTSETDDKSARDDQTSHWEFVKAKHGVAMFKSRRSRCEIRGVTRINASVKNVMSLLAAGESTESFAHAQRILLGNDQVIEARVLASCVPSSASRYFHCGLKYMALKNPFGVHPLDFVFLDYTDVSTTPEGKLIGYRILESIRVPEFRSVAKYIRASIRCEVYIVRETHVPGVVEVTFASHLDPKSKYAASKRSTWLDQTVVRLRNLRSYAEKASFSHRLVLEKCKLVKSETRHHCFLCETSFFSFLRKRHNCRLCGEVSCGRCSRKLPIFVGTETTRVRVCLGCMLQSRRQPDELGRLEVERGRRNSIGNSTWIAYDEMEDVCDEDDEDDHDRDGNNDGD